MEGQVNSYTGMNKDMGRDSIPNNLYIDAQDIRITTTSGESMGSFTNMEGNVEAFTIPTSGNFNGSGWTADNPEIIGPASSPGAGPISSYPVFSLSVVGPSSQATP